MRLKFNIPRTRHYLYNHASGKTHCMQYRQVPEATWQKIVAVVNAAEFNAKMTGDSNFALDALRKHLERKL